MVAELRQQALACLLLTDPLKKVADTQALYLRWQAGQLMLSADNLVLPDLPWPA